MRTTILFVFMDWRCIEWWCCVEFASQALLSLLTIISQILIAFCFLMISSELFTMLYAMRRKKVQCDGAIFSTFEL